MVCQPPIYLPVPKQPHTEAFYANKVILKTFVLFVGRLNSGDSPVDIESFVQIEAEIEKKLYISVYKLGTCPVPSALSSDLVEGPVGVGVVQKFFHFFFQNLSNNFSGGGGREGGLD